MWIIIIVVAVAAFLIFKYYDRDIITATPIDGNKYDVLFENGKNPTCKLIDKLRYNNYDYYVFIPLESLTLRAIPIEDVIILRLFRRKENCLKLVFPDDEADKYVLERILIKHKLNVTE